MRQLTKKDIELAADAASYLDQEIDLSLDEVCDAEEPGWGEAPSQPTCPKAEAEAAERLRGWKAQARALWAKAYMAMESRNFSEMRNFASSAQDAENKSDMLVAAIFGVSTPTPALVALGHKVSDQDAAAARAAVRKNLEAFRASRERKPNPRQAAFAAEAQAEREAFLAGTVHTAINGRIAVGKWSRAISPSSKNKYPQLAGAQPVKVRLLTNCPDLSLANVEPV